MIALLAAVALQAQPAPQPAAVDRFQSTNIVIGACERYVPLDMLIEINRATERATPAMRAQIARWRAEGRAMAIRERLDFRICSALLRNALG